MEKYKDLLDKIDGMSVLELNELVKAIEERFGVSAAAVAAAPAAGGPRRSLRARDEYPKQKRRSVRAAAWNDAVGRRSNDVKGHIGASRPLVSPLMFRPV